MVGLVLTHLGISLVLLGFAYLVLNKAGKDTGKSKLVGQVIGWGIVAVVISACLTCGINQKLCPMCPKHGMTKHCPMKAKMAKDCPVKAEAPAVAK